MVFKSDPVDVRSIASAFLLSAFILVGVSEAQAPFVKHKVDSTFAGAHAVQPIDLDQDGDMDLIGAGMTVGRISWWENVSKYGVSWKERIVAAAFTGARHVGAADLDGDGDPDLYGAAASLDAITWWENSAGDASTWIERPVDTEFDFAMQVYATDIDADGDLDLLGAALKGDAVIWWENLDGKASSWEKHLVSDTFDGARHVCALDIDGDGDADLLGSADIANKIMWWENTAGDATSWSGFVVDSTFEGVNVVLPADLDGDGDVDLVGAADVADDVVWWEQVHEEGGLSWKKHPIATDFNGAFSVAPVDMDNDGDLDVVGAAAEADHIVWWENLTGSGEGWMKHLIDEAFDYPLYINAGDIDGDGDADVVSGAFGGEVAWWANPYIDDIRLPVTLIQFEAMLDREEVVLSWTTASETNNAGFELQHLHMRNVRDTNMGGEPWEPVDFIEGAGTTTAYRSYTYSLNGLSPGLHRFRLKQVDFDGRFHYSPTVELRIDLGDSHKLSDVYPNPFNPRARFSLSLVSPQRVQIDVYNALGQRVARLHEGALEAHETYEFDFEAGNMPGGLYVIHAQGETFSTARTAMLVK